MNNKYFIYREAKKNFRGSTTRRKTPCDIKATTEYIFRRDLEMAGKNNVNFDPNKVEKNIIVKPCEFSYSEQGLNNKQKEAELKQYIDKICKEKGVKPINWNNKKYETKTLFIENLYTISPEWEKEVFKTVRKEYPEFSDQGVINIGTRIINQTLIDMMNEHDKLTELKNFHTVGAIIHLDETDLERLAFDDNYCHSSIHLHQIQIPICEAPCRSRDNFDYDKILEKTQEKYELLEKARREHKNKSQNIKKSKKKTDEEKTIELQEENKRYKKITDELENRYGNYRLKNDDRNVLLDAGNNEIRKEARLEIGTSFRERILCRYERTEDNKLDLSKPIEPVDICDRKTTTFGYYNFLQERMFNNIKKIYEKDLKAVKTGEKDKDGKPIFYCTFGGKQIQQKDYHIKRIQKEVMKSLERGERSLDADGNYKRRDYHIDNTTYRQNALDIENQQKQLAEQRELLDNQEKIIADLQQEQQEAFRLHKENIRLEEYLNEKKKENGLKTLDDWGTEAEDKLIINYLKNNQGFRTELVNKAYKEKSRNRNFDLDRDR